jgi:hypothetical protein
MDYAEAASALELSRLAAQQAFAAEFGPIFRGHVEAMRQTTFADKKAIAKWVNAELKRFGLAIRCPKTGQPSAMVADRGEGNGRFQLYHHDGKRQVRTFSASKLFPLELMAPGTVHGPHDMAPRLSSGIRRMPVTPAGIDYGAVARQLDDADQRFRRTVAEHLEAAINDHLGNLAQATYAQKQELARWVNNELRRFGLAIKCPKTGLPAILLADPGDDDRGRFQLDVRVQGKSKRTVSSVKLFQLTLIPDVRAEII